IFKPFVPLGPGILLARWRSRLQDFPAGGKGGGDGRTQFPGQTGDGLFDANFMTIDLLGAKKVREFLEDVVANHQAGLLRERLLRILNRQFYATWLSRAMNRLPAGSIQSARPLLAKAS